MATYVPNAEQLTEPTSSRMVGSAAEEFRVLKTSVDVRADSLEADVDVLLADMSQAQDDIDVLQNQMTAVGLGTDSVALAVNLASTASGKGAALVGVQDAANNYNSAQVEAVLAEIAARIGQVCVLATEPRFGAVADSNGTAGNGTDNTAAFTAACAYAVANRCTLVIPGGNGLMYRHT